MDITKILLNKGAIPLYLQIYNQIKEMIINQELSEEERLPSIRIFSEKLNINNITIINAYNKLEKEGFVYKKTGSGSFVKNKNTKYITSTMDLSGKDSNIDVFPLDDFKDSINHILNTDGVDAFKYEDSRGNSDLKKSLSRYLEYYKITTPPELIQIVSGGQQALDIISKSLLQFGDTVFTEIPTYRGAIESFKSREARIIQVTLQHDGMDMEELESKLQVRKPVLIYMMPFNQKPTGITYSNEKKIKLLKLADKYNFFIVEDDIGSELLQKRDLSGTLKSMDKNDRVIYIKSFTPLFMPGLRLGCLVPPGTLYNKLLTTKLSTDISTPGLIQRSLSHYLNKENWLKYYDKLSKTLYKKTELTKLILERDFKELLELASTPETCRFWFKLKQGDGEVLNKICMDNGIEITPGITVGADYTNYFRISLNSIPYQNIEKALSVLKNSLIKLYSIKDDNKITFY